jgi:hypothetical protein
MTTGVAAGFSWADGPAGRTLHADALTGLARHAFTTRDLSFRDEGAVADYRRLAAAFELEPGAIHRVRQVHGREVLVVPADAGAPGEDTGERAAADAVVVMRPGEVACVRVADCVPILLADTRHRAVAAVHAGWRGSCIGVIGETIAALAEAGVPPGGLVAAVGPSIGACCYQVDDRVRTTFLGMTPAAAAWFTEDGPGRWRLDLWQAAVDQLEDAGVPPNAIHVARLCTADHPTVCFSYRREGPAAGRLAAAIQMPRDDAARPAPATARS